MSDQPVFQAEFCSLRTLESKPYVILKFSVPSEGLAHVVEGLGSPKPGESIWVEIRRLNPASD